MAKKSKGVFISRRVLGGAVLLGILFQYLLPMIGISFLSKFSLVLYLIVGLYLFLF